MQSKYNEKILTNYLDSRSEENLIDKTIRLIRMLVLKFLVMHGVKFFELIVKSFDGLMFNNNKLKLSLNFLIVLM